MEPISTITRTTFESDQSKHGCRYLRSTATVGDGVNLALPVHANGSSGNPGTITLLCTRQRHAQLLKGRRRSKTSFDWHNSWIIWLRKRGYPIGRFLCPESGLERTSMDQCKYSSLAFPLRKHLHPREHRIPKGVEFPLVLLTVMVAGLVDSYTRMYGNMRL